jgi:ribonuclease E
MANKMLIDASHPEETRVVVVRGNRVEEFDFESAARRPLRGNIYLAKVTRVEPSLQACFVDYGGNRHGFLAFSEIHPDYYQIPVADRQALIAEDARAARAAESDEPRGRHREMAKAAPREPAIAETPAEEQSDREAAPAREAGDADNGGEPVVDAPALNADGNGGTEAAERSEEPAEEVVESVGSGDALEEVPERAQPRRHRRYKIQEVIKRRQIMLVQVVKEERGTKGAAMTTYLSLAGRYSVLMPNTSRGGGISRKITDAGDRKRLKELVEDLEVPEGMGVILRTAGAARNKTEIKRDFEYLLRLWETVRELTLKSTAPALVYEEGSLTKRAIRDLYNKDIDEVLVAGEEGYKEAKEFMRMLTPSHAKNVKLYKESQPIFTRYGVESQLDAMFSPVVQLKSGGYIVINPAEALVAIDVNSGRATREHHIEDTALRTNLEAAEEIARQLRLRDLAGLIVIDFIDMDEKRNNRNVERKLKDSLKHDRARIQVGRISHFGLMEMSRQRIRTGVLESSTVVCPQCGGTGHVRSVASVSLHLLRSLEEQLTKSSSHDLIVRTRPDVALYLLNQKRAHLRELEQRFGVNILIQSDSSLSGQQYFAVDKGPPARARAAAPPRVGPETVAPAEEKMEEEEEEERVQEPVVAREGGEPGGRRRRRRRRGRRGGGGEREPQAFVHETVPEHRVEHAEDYEEVAGEGEEAAAPRAPEGEGGRRRRRRGRRGGRRHRRERYEAGAELPREGGAERPEMGAPEPFRSVTEPRPEPPFVSPGPLSPRPTPEPQPKRGSTVREPAPVVRFGEAAPSPPVSYERPVSPAPAPEPQPEEGETRPRRSGWWQRR